MRWQRAIAMSLRRAGWEHSHCERMSWSYRRHYYRKGRCVVLVEAVANRAHVTVQRLDRHGENEWHVSFTEGTPVPLILEAARRAHRGYRLDTKGRVA